MDGFGLIAFASLFPMISVMAYAQASEWRAVRDRPGSAVYVTDQLASQEDAQ